MLTRRTKAYSMPMLTCNRYHERLRLTNIEKIATFRRNYRSLMPLSAGFLEPRKLRLGPLKSTLNSENSLCSLSMSISIGFGAIRS